MKSPINRLLFYGIFGLGIATAMIGENYISKRNTLWEYVIGITLFIFSIIFLFIRYRIIKKNK